MESEPNKQNEVRNRLYCNGEIDDSSKVRKSGHRVYSMGSFIKTCGEIFMPFPSVTCHLRCGHFIGLIYRNLLSSSNHTYI